MSCAVGNVVPFSLLVKPDPHDSIRRGVVEDLVGAGPSRLRFVAFAVAANEQADKEADDDDRDDDQQNESHCRYDFLKVTAVP